MKQPVLLPSRAKRLIILILAVIFAASACSGCRQQSTANSITIAGSTTVLTIAQASAELFMERNPKYRVFVQGGGSSAGVEAAYTAAAQIGMTSRDLKGEELKLGLKTIPIAYDAIAVIVNPKNRIRSLTHRQLKDIYTGKITNWKQIGGADLDIVLVNRDEASGTREAFGKKVLGNAEFIKDAVIQPGSGQVRSIVAATPAAIGYLSLGYVDKQVQVVEVDGIFPTAANVRQGKYPLHRRLYMLTKSDVSPLTERFIDFILSEEIQKEIVSVEFVPIETS